MAARTRSLHQGAGVRSAPSSRALGLWLRGRARSTRFRSRSCPSLGGAGTRLRTRRSCRLRDSQCRAAQGRSVAADGASQRGARVAFSDHHAAVAEQGRGMPRRASSAACEESWRAAAVS